MKLNSLFQSGSSVTLLMLSLAFPLFTAGCNSGDSPSPASASSGELEKLREENKEVQKLRTDNADLPKLRKENEELQKLRGATEELAKLKKENDELRSQIDQFKQTNRSAQPLRPK